MTRTHQKSLVSGNHLKTKIVCTIGPGKKTSLPSHITAASSSKEMIAKLVDAGMSVMRINMAHCSHENAAQIIKNLRDHLAETKSTCQIGVWLDINGPKIRTGRLRDGQPIFLKAGEEIAFVNENIVGDETKVSTTYTKELVGPGEKIFIDDGLLCFTVLERTSVGIRCRIENSGYLGENKGITFPTRIVQDMAAISAKDKTDIQFAIAQDVDYVSISCIRNIEDVEEARFLLGNTKVKLIAKIENYSGMQHYESILRMADGIEIDRGYLGAEVDLDIVATAQKKMIEFANTAGKPVLIANQVLESMKDHPRPTRSEAADIANAVMDGADGLVLSSETAIGEYVVPCVEMMRKIAFQAEKATNYVEFTLKQMRNIPKPIGVSESIASSAVTATRQIDARLIICLTEQGGIARLVAKYRPNVPVIVSTMVPKTARHLSMIFGVIPFHHDGPVETLTNETMRFAVELGLAQRGDTVVMTSGQVVGFHEGTTTKMQVAQIPEDL